MNDVNTITKEYITLLQDYIDESAANKKKKHKILKYSKELGVVLQRCVDMGRTSKLSCFNGVYDINQESLDYYINELALEHKLKIKKDDYFPDSWIIVNKNHEIMFDITSSPHKIKGVNANYISIEFLDLSVQMHCYSFSELDHILSLINEGHIFKEFKH